MRFQKSQGVKGGCCLQLEVEEEEATLLEVRVEGILGGQGILGVLGQHKVFLAAEQAIKDG